MTAQSRYPRRDADGRLAAVGDLLGVTAAGLVIGVVVLLVFDAVVVLLRLGEFGAASGWLAVVLPAWLFVEDFRAAPYGPGRIVVALLGGGFGLAVGLTAAGLAAPFPPLVSGAIGAAAMSVVYVLIWFYGLRWLAHRTG